MRQCAAFNAAQTEYHATLFGGRLGLLSPSALRREEALEGTTASSPWVAASSFASCCRGAWGSSVGTRLDVNICQQSGTSRRSGRGRCSRPPRQPTLRSCRVASRTDPSCHRDISRQPRILSLAIDAERGIMRDLLPLATQYGLPGLLIVEVMWLAWTEGATPNGGERRQKRAATPQAVGQSDCGGSNGGCVKPRRAWLPGRPPRQDAFLTYDRASWVAPSWAARLVRHPLGFIRRNPPFPP